MTCFLAKQNKFENDKTHNSCRSKSHICIAKEKNNPSRMCHANKELGSISFLILPGLLLHIQILYWSEERINFPRENKFSISLRPTQSTVKICNFERQFLIGSHLLRFAQKHIIQQLRLLSLLLSKNYVYTTLMTLVESR